MCIRDRSKEANRAIEQLQEKYPGLRITPLMDQGDYIQMTVSSVLSNLAWGGVLAVIVLAIFLKDFKPTLVVALSIPISLMFAVVLMLSLIHIWIEKMVHDLITV